MIKENIRYEASALAKVQLYLLESVDPEHEHIPIYKSDADYYGDISIKAKAERDEYLDKRKGVFNNIKTLRTKASSITGA